MAKSSICQLKISVLMAAVFFSVISPSHAGEGEDISGAFGVVLGSDGRELASRGFEADTRREGKRQRYTWYHYDHAFFDIISVVSHLDSYSIDTIGAGKYYREAEPLVDLAACEEDYLGMLAVLEERYPSFSSSNGKSLTFDRIYAHYRSVILTPPSGEVGSTRTITLVCHSGSKNADQPVPALYIEYGSSQRERLAAYKASLEVERDKARQNVEGQGLRPGEM